MSTQKMRRLSNSLTLAAQRSNTPSVTPPKIQTARVTAQRHYLNFSNNSKMQQQDIVRDSVSARRKQWRHDHYRISSSFSLNPQESMEPFPHNNVKYNTQFLPKTLKGGTLHHPTRPLGYFTPPSEQLLSNHYKPILKDKQAYNQDYELRTSLFDMTWVDHKRDSVMDQYRMQANPFRTPRSNALISTMRPDRRHRHPV